MTFEGVGYGILCGPVGVFVDSTLLSLLRWLVVD